MKRIKYTDDYKAKLRIWAENQMVAPLAESPTLPSFSSQKFRSHIEMNRWKQSLLRRSAQLASRDE